MPLLGNPTAAVLYPGKLIYAALPYAWGARVYILAHVVLAFGAMVALMRSWRASWTAAGLSALAYTFAGPILFQYCNIIYLVGAAWLPLGVLAADRWVRLGSRRALLGLALVLAMQTLGGDPQASYLLGLCRLRVRGRRRLDGRPRPRRRADGPADKVAMVDLSADRRRPDRVGRDHAGAGPDLSGIATPATRRQTDAAVALDALGFTRGHGRLGNWCGGVPREPSEGEARHGPRTAGVRAGGLGGTGGHADRRAAFTGDRVHAADGSRGRGGAARHLSVQRRADSPGRVVLAELLRVVLRWQRELDGFDSAVDHARQDLGADALHGLLRGGAGPPRRFRSAAVRRGGSGSRSSSWSRCWEASASTRVRSGGRGGSSRRRGSDGRASARSTHQTTRRSVVTASYATATAASTGARASRCRASVSFGSPAS